MEINEAEEEEEEEDDQDDSSVEEGRSETDDEDVSEEYDLPVRRRAGKSGEMESNPNYLQDIYTELLKQVFHFPHSPHILSRYSPPQILPQLSTLRPLPILT